MRVYVAAKFEDQALVLETYRRLREAGHVITCDWTALPTGDRHWGANAVRDLAGVLDADAIILYPHDRGKGLYVELGAALATYKRVVAITANPADESLFLYHPLVRMVGSLDEALSALELG